MVHWYCSSVLCFNNFKTVDSQGQKLKYYRLPRGNVLQAKYKRFFKTDGFNWKTGFICSTHWSSGERKSPSDLPDIAVPKEQYELIKKKYERAKATADSSNKPTTKQILALRKAKQRFRTAMYLFKNPPQVKKKVRQREAMAKRSFPPTKRSKVVTKPVLNNEELQSELEKANKYIQKLEAEVAKKKEELTEANRKNLRLMSELYDCKSKQFKYENFKCNLQKFEYLCGLTVERFNMVMDCVRPYLHLIPYPDCKVSENLYTYESQFLCTLVICRHGIDLRFMAFIMDTSESTVQRIFNGWVMFLATLFNRLDLTPAHGCLLQKMSKVFMDTGHGLTDIIIDATEFKFQCASNFELNSLMFSNYKNTQTGKALIGISPHGMGLLFSDIYPGSISDSEITEKSGVLQFVEESHEIMSDRGFAIQDMCAIKGVFLNRPKQKDADQFSQSEVQRNFDIASTRIHVERFIGRVRDWTILNKVWPLNRMDLLSPTWQMLCHLVNITMPPIGPKT